MTRDGSEYIYNAITSHSAVPFCLVVLLWSLTFYFLLPLQWLATIEPITLVFYNVYGSLSGHCFLKLSDVPV